MNRKVLLAGLVITLPFIVLLVMSLGRDPHKVNSPLVGRSAPLFALRGVGGASTIDLTSFRGKPVIVNFWATWCVPCYTEHAVLTSAARALEGEVAFLGVVYDDKEQTILEFLRQNGSSYPVLLDDTGKTAVAYGVHGVPETFFVSAGGKIVAKHEGPLDPSLLYSNIQKAKESLQ